MLDFSKKYKVNEAAEIMGYHPTYLRDLLRQGQIKGFKMGQGEGRWRIEGAEIHRFMYEGPISIPKEPEPTGEEVVNWREKDWLSTEESFYFLKEHGIERSIRTICDWAFKGRNDLICEKVGERDWRIKRESLENFINRRGKKK